MSETNSSGALEVSLAYDRAWTGKDFDQAMTYIAFGEFMGPFSQIVTRDELISAFGDDRTALIMYDTDTVPVSHAPGAEFHTVEDGKITHITIIFDRQPFTDARNAGTP